MKGGFQKTIGKNSKEKPKDEKLSQMRLKEDFSAKISKPNNSTVKLKQNLKTNFASNSQRNGFHVKTNKMKKVQGTNVKNERNVPTRMEESGEGKPSQRNLELVKSKKRKFDQIEKEEKSGTKSMKKVKVKEGKREEENRSSSKKQIQREKAKAQVNRHQKEESESEEESQFEGNESQSEGDASWSEDESFSNESESEGSGEESLFEGDAGQFEDEHLDKELSGVREPNSKSSGKLSKVSENWKKLKVNFKNLLTKLHSTY